jgi:hypothetical protein
MIQRLRVIGSGSIAGKNRLDQKDPGWWPYGLDLPLTAAHVAGLATLTKKPRRLTGAKAENPNSILRSISSKIVICDPRLAAFWPPLSDLTRPRAQLLAS